MRFHMLQNVQTSLDYLRYRKVYSINDHNLNKLFFSIFESFFKPTDQVGEHSSRGHRGQQLKVDIRTDLDNHPSLPGESSLHHIGGR